MSVMTPKQLANKMKAKGLQKLRWYCYSPDTQLLTGDGFKFVGDITSDDDIATYDRNQNHVIYHKPSPGIGLIHQTGDFNLIIITRDVDNNDGAQPRSSSNTKIKKPRADFSDISIKVKMARLIIARDIDNDNDKLELLRKKLLHGGDFNTKQLTDALARLKRSNTTDQLQSLATTKLDDDDDHNEEGDDYDGDSSRSSASTTSTGLDLSLSATDVRHVGQGGKWYCGCTGQRGYSSKKCLTQSPHYQSEHKNIIPIKNHYNITSDSASDSSSSKLSNKRKSCTGADDYRSNNVSLCITHDHDIFIQCGVWYESGDSRKNYYNAQNQGYSVMKAVTLLENKSNKCFTSLAVVQNGIGDGFDHDQIKHVLEQEMQLDNNSKLLSSPAKVEAFLQLYGWWLGDGSIRVNDSSQGQTGAITLEPKKPFDKTFIEDLLAILEVDYSTSKRERQQDCYSIYCNQLYQYFVGEVGNKYKYGIKYNLSSVVLVDSIKSAKWFFWWAKKLSRKLLRLVFFGLRVADGTVLSYKEKGDDSAGGIIYTSSVHFRDQLMQLLLHAGYNAYFKLTYPKGSVRGESEHGTPMIATADNWRVHYNQSDITDNPVCYCDRDVKMIKYTGDVYCVNVPNHLVIARRAITRKQQMNGASIWNGTINEKHVPSDDKYMNEIVEASKAVICGNCQMCEKQCRDENGFKCHCMSEAHTRQMALFRDNPEKYMDQYSQDFEDEFMAILRRKGGTRVKANTVYQEMVADRGHVHMNSTKWATLTNFIQYLGKENMAVVDQTPKGWYVRYIDRDPDMLRRQEAMKKREATVMDEQERADAAIQKQIELAKQAEEDAGLHQNTPAPTELVKSEDQTLQFTMSSSSSSSTSTSSDTSMPAPAPIQKPKLGISAFAIKNEKKLTPSSSTSSSSTSSSSSSTSQKRKLSAMEEIMREEEARKAKIAKKNESTASSSSESAPVTAEGWLFPNITVKIMNKTLLHGKLYKKKGIVLRVRDTYTGEVCVDDMDDNKPVTIWIDEAELETVIPAIGKKVKIVAGKYKGEEAILLEIKEATFSVTVRISGGILDGREVSNLPFEHVCKLV